jgi:hypothetical protein
MTVSRNGVEYEVTDETDTEVCVLVPMEYHSEGTKMLPCWWSKSKLDDWIDCDGEIWDYEKSFYQVRLKDGSLHWVWPNAGHLTDLSELPNRQTHNQQINIEDVTAYRMSDYDHSTGWRHDERNRLEQKS